MKLKVIRLTIVVASGCFAQVALAECKIAEELTKLDPIEAGFCEADAVFTGKVESRMETARAFRPEGEEKTTHFLTETSGVRVGTSYKGKLPEKVTMKAELYDKGETYSFAAGKEYVIFAKKLSVADQFSGMTAKCSVQSTLFAEDAKSILDRLEQHRKGRKKIDCKHIAQKSESVVTP